MRVIVDIEESKLNRFLDELNKLDYVRVVEDDVARDQEIESLKRWQAIESGELKTRKWSDIQASLFKK